MGGDLWAYLRIIPGILGFEIIRPNPLKYTRSKGLSGEDVELWVCFGFAIVVGGVLAP
jgi:hypothetical protein